MHHAPTSTCTMPPYPGMPQGNASTPPSPNPTAPSHAPLPYSQSRHRMIRKCRCVGAWSTAPTALANARTTCTRSRPPRLSRTRRSCRCVGAWSSNHTHSRTPNVHQEPPSAPQSDEAELQVRWGMELKSHPLTQPRTTCTRSRPPRLSRTRRSCRCVGAWSTYHTLMTYTRIVVGVWQLHILQQHHGRCLRRVRLCAAITMPVPVGRATDMHRLGTKHGRQRGTRPAAHLGQPASFRRRRYRPEGCGERLLSSSAGRL